jgi:hypothetical protein
MDGGGDLTETTGFETFVLEFECWGIAKPIPHIVHIKKTDKKLPFMTPPLELQSKNFLD